MMKLCPRCGRNLPETRDYWYMTRRVSNTGHVYRTPQGWCKDCMKAYQKKRAKTLRDRIREAEEREAQALESLKDYEPESIGPPVPTDDDLLGLIDPVGEEE